MQFNPMGQVRRVAWTDDVFAPKYDDTCASGVYKANTIEQVLVRMCCHVSVQKRHSSVGAILLTRWVESYRLSVPSVSLLFVLLMPVRSLIVFISISVLPYTLFFRGGGWTSGKSNAHHDISFLSIWFCCFVVFQKCECSGLDWRCWVEHLWP